MKQELRPDIDGSLLLWTHMHRRVPVEAQLLFAVVRFWLDEARLQSEPIDAGDKAALRFRINVTGIGWIRKRPESVSAAKIFPPAIGNPAGILGVAHPHAVVLQPTKNVIRISIVRAHVIELRDRQVVTLPPGVAAIVGVPDASVVAGDEVIGIIGIYPHIVEIAVCSIGDRTEAFSAVFA